MLQYRRAARIAPSQSEMPEQKTTLGILRQALLAILVLGITGTELELLLLRHTDGFWQLIPVVLNGLVLLALGWFAMSRSAASIRILRGILLLCLISGGVGVVRHYSANLRDAGESNPGTSGRELYKEAIQGSIPALAPGTMVQLALIGLAFTFRHPVLTGVRREDEIIT
jgi:hypothetical protein